MLVHGRARALSVSNALACVVQLVTFDPRGATALPHGTDAQSGQASAAAAHSAPDSTGGGGDSARHSPHPVTLKRCGIPSLLDRGCASGPESVQGTITRQSAPLYLFLSSCPRRGNKHVG